MVGGSALRRHAGRRHHRATHTAPAPLRGDRCRCCYQVACLLAAQLSYGYTAILVVAERVELAPWALSTLQPQSRRTLNRTE